MIEILNQYDTRLFLFLNNLHSPFSDSLWMFITGKWFWLFLYLPLLYFIVKKYKWRTIEIVLLSIIIITCTDQVANLMKSGIMRPRPCKVNELLPQIHLLKGCSDYGFVSGHAANAFGQITMLISLNLFSSSRERLLSIWLMILWATLVALSRIFVGVHYPLDVICGGAIGVLIAIIIIKIKERILNKINPNMDFHKNSR
jgi:undecaprenyl-diphosphatase